MEFFYALFDSYCRGCGDDIAEGDTVGFVPETKGLHCKYCVLDAYIEFIG